MLVSKLISLFHWLLVKGLTRELFVRLSNVTQHVFRHHKVTEICVVTMSLGFVMWHVTAQSSGNLWWYMLHHKATGICDDTKSRRLVIRHVTLQSLGNYCCHKVAGICNNTNSRDFLTLANSHSLCLSKISVSSWPF